MKNLFMTVVLMLSVACGTAPVSTPAPMVSHSDVQDTKEAKDLMGKAIAGIATVLCGPDVQEAASSWNLDEGVTKQLNGQRVFVTGYISHVEPETIIDTDGQEDIDVFLPKGFYAKVGDRVTICVKANTAKIMTGSLNAKYVGIYGEVAKSK